MTLQDRINEFAKNTWVKSIISGPTRTSLIENGDSIYQISFLEINDNLDTVTTRNQSFYVLNDGSACYHISKPVQIL